MKKVPESHIIGERGVNAFRTYCNYHNPYIMFRPTSENDFGIDYSIEQEDACLIDVVNVGINVLNNSCTTVLPDNTRMVYRYQIDNDPVVEEVFFTDGCFWKAI